MTDVVLFFGRTIRTAASLDRFFGRHTRCTRLLWLLAWSQTIQLRRHDRGWHEGADFGGVGRGERRKAGRDHYGQRMPTDAGYSYRSIAPHASSEDFWSLIESWLSNCDSSHLICNQNKRGKILPSRALDVTAPRRDFESLLGELAIFCDYSTST